MSQSGTQGNPTLPRDEVSVVTAEFEYSKGLEGAATAYALSRITNSLPQDIKQPQIYKIGAYTPPVMIWALSPHKNSNLTLADVRYLAANSIADQLVKVRAIANVDIFGGYEKEVVVEINKDKLSSYDLKLLIHQGTWWKKVMKICLLP